MPIDSQHSEYQRALSEWDKCRDASQGQECVHAKKEAYLPRLSAQDDDQYQQYLERALYYNATGRTIDGLSGLIFRRPPTVNVPASLDYLQTDVDTAGTPLLAFCERAVEELIRKGRLCLLADFPVAPVVPTLADEKMVGQRPFARMFCPEQVINWHVESINGKQTLTLVVIAEEVDVPKDDYTWECEDQLRALRLVDGQYLIELWRKRKNADGTVEWYLFEGIVPKISGQPLDFIPFTFCGPMGVSTEVTKSPILDLVNVNLSHYRSTADYEHGLHFTALPTPVVTGHQFQLGEQLALGSTQAQAFQNPNAKVFFLEFQGAGLTNLSNRLKEKEEMMAALGARMLGAEKKAAETAETAAIHRSGENGVLASLANAASGALSTVLTWCAQWAGVKEPVTIELNTDYLPSGMTAQELTALVGALQAGAISRATFYDNLQRGELAQQGIDFETEKTRIEEDGPALGLMQTAPMAGLSQPGAADSGAAKA